MAVPWVFNRSMPRILRITTLVLLVAIVAVLLYKDTIISFAAQKTSSSAIGAELSIGHFSWNLLTARITIKDIKIGHPPGFEKGVFADIPLIETRYDVPALLSGTWHLPRIRIELKEMTVIKDGEGRLNIDEFKILKDAKSRQAEESAGDEAKADPKFLIDELKLTIGQVVYKDHYKKENPRILVYDINIKDRVIMNIDSVPKLAAAVILQAVKKTAIQGAGMYAAAAVMGVGFLPGAVLGVVVSDDDAVKDFDKGFGSVVAGCESFLREKGTLTQTDRKNGVVKGKVDGVDIRVDIQKLSWFKTRVKVTARKLMLPKPEFAGGVLYQIAEKLK